MEVEATRRVTKPQKTSTASTESVLIRLPYASTTLVPRESLARSGCFRAHADFAQRLDGATSLMKEMEIAPPDPLRTLECLAYISGHPLPSYCFEGSHWISMLRNADFLQIDDILKLCYNSFWNEWKTIIKNPSFKHSTIPVTHLEKILDINNGLSSIEKAEVMLEWANAPNFRDQESIYKLVRKHCTDATWTAWAVDNLAHRFKDTVYQIIPPDALLQLMRTVCQESRSWYLDHQDDCDLTPPPHPQTKSRAIAWPRGRAVVMTAAGGDGN
ncbi:hypothetical protein SpCBS45565_g07738 [Spizellomyces sp. 'palustris']|nr:hypothetical protein SpCBS45565_g07738 [Spizellomyces sp. 'palustris']